MNFNSESSYSTMLTLNYVTGPPSNEHRCDTPEFEATGPGFISDKGGGGGRNRTQRKLVVVGGQNIYVCIMMSPSQLTVEIKKLKQGVVVRK